MTIGERIRALRHMHEYPQSFLAETVGIKKQTLYKYENDIITNIPIDKLISIAAALGVSPAYLIGCDEESPEKKWIYDFRDRLGEALGNVDTIDATESYTDLQRFWDIVEGKISITLPEAYEISSDIDVSFLYLCGITDTDKMPTPVSVDGLDDLDKLLIQHLRNLTPDVKRMILAQLQVMKESQQERQPSSAQE